jgi:hypothetical protein
MNVEIGTEATLFPEKEYISGIFVAVYPKEKANSKENGQILKTKRQSRNLLLLSL